MGFLQLTPENIAQAKSLSYPEAFKLDRTLGYNPNFKGGVGPVKYGIEGFKSIFGLGDQKIGGATPLTRKLALDAADLAKSFGGKALNFLSKASLPLSILTPTSLGADDMLTQEMRDEIDITEELDNYYEEGERMPNVKDAREKGLGELLESLSGGAVNLGKDIASRGIMSKALGNVGNIVFGVPGAMMGSLAGLIKGGDMFKQSYDPFYKQFADPSQRGAGFKDRYGINTASAFGDYGKYALNKAYGVNALGGDKGDFYRDVVAKKNAAMTDANIGFEDRGSDSGSSQSSSRESAVEQEQSNRDAARGRF